MQRRERGEPCDLQDARDSRIDDDELEASALTGERARLRGEDTNA